MRHAVQTSYKKEAAKKVLQLVVGPLREGGGVVKAGPLRKKNFYENQIFFAASLIALIATIHKLEFI